tara:strand:- start:282 stop:440 length:159 start_codon:yes stop_codon:yes gene_type:complete
MAIRNQLEIHIYNDLNTFYVILKVKKGAKLLVIGEDVGHGRQGVAKSSGYII